LNEVVPAALAELPDPEMVEVRHQTGARNLAAAEVQYRTLRLAARPVGFIDDMGAAYAWADLVVCRAGATTLAELMVSGTASVLVPFPYATDDHQTLNARFLADAGAAVLMTEADLNPGCLSRLIVELCHARDRLVRMAERARALAVPDASERVARHCLEVAHG
jgi:UDP-N-acetylglucosamine--N-acetylmuramyl-(pentapeptide) pyrophosphoryl-undecaprenol N-acetylglucosamine transferase